MLRNCVQLANPDYPKPFSIKTDASQKGFGAHLWQKHATIPFGSRSPKVNETKIMVPIELEKHGILFAIKHSKTMIDGSKIIIYIDHDPIAKIRNLGIPDDAQLGPLNFQNMTMKFVIFQARKMSLPICSLDC